MAITLKEAFDALMEVDERIDEMPDQVGGSGNNLVSFQVINKLKIEKAISEQQRSISIEIDGERRVCTFEELIQIYNEKRRKLVDLKREKRSSDPEYLDLSEEFTYFMEQVWGKEGAPLVLDEKVENIIRILVKDRVLRILAADEGEASNPVNPVDALKDASFLKTQFVMVGPGFIIRGDHANGLAGRQMVVPRDINEALRLGMSAEDAAFFNNPLKDKEVFGLGEGEVVQGIFGDNMGLPKLKPEMFPDVEDGGVIVEGKMQFVMAGMAPELGCDCEVLIGDDGRVYADNDLFRGRHDERVRLIKEGDGFRVEKV